MMAVTNITSMQQFQNMMNNSNQKPLFIDFTAEWCGPCKMIASRIEEFAKQYPNIQFIRIDVDEFDEIVTKYKIQAMPTFIAMFNETELFRIMGAKEKYLVLYLEELHKKIGTGQHPFNNDRCKL
eukprot:555420_1